MRRIRTRLTYGTTIFSMYGILIASVTYINLVVNVCGCARFAANMHTSDKSNSIWIFVYCIRRFQWSQTKLQATCIYLFWNDCFLSRCVAQAYNASALFLRVHLQPRQNERSFSSREPRGYTDNKWRYHYHLYSYINKTILIFFCFCFISFLYIATEKLSAYTFINYCLLD